MKKNHIFFIIGGILIVLLCLLFFQIITDKKNEKLYIAIKNQDKKGVLQSLNSGARINKQTYDFPTPLIYACIYGDADIVKTLLQNGADVNQRTVWGNSAITTASKRGNLEIVKLLLEHGANKNYRAPGSNTAFEAAASYGRLNIIQFFMNNYKIHEKEFNNAFRLASKNGHVDILHFLFDNKHKVISELDIALFDATANRLKEQYSTVKFLIDIGADVNTVEYGYSVLDKAIYFKHSKIIELLKKHGAKTSKELQAEMKQ